MFVGRARHARFFRAGTTHAGVISRRLPSFRASSSRGEHSRSSLPPIRWRLPRKSSIPAYQITTDPAVHAGNTSSQVDAGVRVMRSEEPCDELFCS